MNTFRADLEQELRQSRTNNFGSDNYDEERFGKIPLSKKLLNSAKEIVKRTTGYQKITYNKFLAGALLGLAKYENDLEYVYSNLGTQSKDLLIKLIAYRILGYKKVKLPRNNRQYWEALKAVKALKDTKDTYDPHFMHFRLEKFDLSPIGYNVKVYFNDLGIVIDYIIEQYAYKQDNTAIVCAEKGETVFDIGGCWGDTALYFASKVGENGKVYSFEFIPDNIKLFNINRSLNQNLSERIELIPNPVSDKPELTIYFEDRGPSSKIRMQPFESQTGFTTTVSIDDFVTKNNIRRVDFIKMDIEGAEPMALMGAVETIKKFKPKLAIANYHSISDFVNIPKWILDLNLGYELFMGHYTIHEEETICFAKIKNK